MRHVSGILNWVIRYGRCVKICGWQVPFRDSMEEAYNGCWVSYALSLRTADHRKLCYLSSQGIPALLQPGPCGGAAAFGNHRVGHVSERGHAFCGKAAVARSVHSLHWAR